MNYSQNKGVPQAHSLYVDMQLRSKSWPAKILHWYVTSSLFEWLTCGFSAPLQSFDYYLFVRVHVDFYMHLHSVIFSWCLIGKAAKETILDTPKIRSQLSKRSTMISTEKCRLYIILYNTVYWYKLYFKTNYGSIMLCSLLTRKSNLDHWLSTYLYTVHPYPLAFTLTVVADHPTISVCQCVCVCVCVCACVRACVRVCVRVCVIPPCKRYTNSHDFNSSGNGVFKIFSWGWLSLLMTESDDGNSCFFCISLYVLCTYVNNNSHHLNIMLTLNSRDQQGKLWLPKNLTK